MIELLLIDDHKVIHNAVELNFMSEDDFEVIGLFKNFNDAKDTIETDIPSENKRVILLDIGLQKGSGLQLIHQIKRISSNSFVILFTANDSDFFNKQAFKEGADGFFSKSSDMFKLKEYILSVIFSTKKQLNSTANRLNILDELSDKEKLVFVELYKGKSYKIIADELCISIKTVEAHQRSIFKKFDVSSRVELIHLAQKSGFKIEV